MGCELDGWEGVEVNAVDGVDVGAAAMHGEGG
jgi:hypothetical protein